MLANSASEPGFKLSRLGHAHVERRLASLRKWTTGNRVTCAWVCRTVNMD